MQSKHGTLIKGKLTLPFVNFQLAAFETLVVRLRLRLVVWVVVLGKVRVGQRLRRCYPFVCVQNQHSLQQVHRYSKAAVKKTRISI